MSRSTFLAWSSACAALLAAAALAQADRGPNGGELRFADGYRLELVVRSDGPKVAEGPLVVHVATAEGEPVRTRGAIGRATVIAGALRGIATLHPAGDSMLKGFALYPARPDLTVAVSIRLPGRTQPVEASFRPLEDPPASGR